MKQPAWIALQITARCGEHVDDIVKIQERVIVPVRAENRAVIQEFLRRLTEQSGEFELKEV